MIIHFKKINPKVQRYRRVFRHPSVNGKPVSILSYIPFGKPVAKAELESCYPEPGATVESSYGKKYIITDEGSLHRIN